MGERISICCGCLGSELKRIYVSVLVTALLALFLLGKFLDEVFDAQIDVFDAQEFSSESKLLNSISQQLQLVPAENLNSELLKWRKILDIDLTFEQQQNLSLSNELMQKVNSETGLVIDSEEYVEIIRGIDNHPTMLLVLTTLPKNHPSKNNNSELEIWLTLLFYLGFCLILAIWAFPLARRLTRLDQMASEFGAGDLSQRIVTSRFSYIETLETSFNRMANQIEDLIAENKLLAGSISHDLRTPLSCLRFGVDAALETETNQKKNYYLKRMDDDLTRMENMLEAFLDYASLERKRFELVKSEVNVVKLVETTINGCQLLADKHGKAITFASSVDSKAALYPLDPGWFSRAIMNLLTNAINYSEQQVSVSCRQKSNALIIVIEDDGPGIPDADQENVFRAFVKLDKSRTQSDHFGLGLAIVSRVISWHDATIQLTRSELLGGAKFIIQLKH